MISGVWHLWVIYGTVVFEQLDAVTSYQRPRAYTCLPKPEVWGASWQNWGYLFILYFYVCCISNCIRSWETLGSQCEKAHTKLWSLSNNPIVPKQPRIYYGSGRADTFSNHLLPKLTFSPLDRLACTDPIQKRERSLLPPGADYAWWCF